MAVIKTYKADLKARYSRYVKLSLIFTLAIVIAAFRFSPKGKIIEPIDVDSTLWITVEDIENTVQKPKPPPPPQPEPLFADLSDDIEQLDFDDNDLVIDEQVDQPPPLPDPPATDENGIYEFLPIEDQPTPIGGMLAIQEKVYYPEFDKRAGIEGKVVIQAVVDKQGNIVDAVVIKGIGGRLDKIALNAVVTTKFNPGTQRGKPVNVRIWIPIKFVLN